MASNYHFNYKDFKFVKEDGGCVVLKHKDGHELRIATSGLSKEAKEALKEVKNKPKEEPKKMAKGGKVDTAMDKLEPKEFEYKDPKAPGAKPGKQLGIMAQDLEKSEMGEEAVEDTPNGKMVDVAETVPMLLASVARLNERLKLLEGVEKAEGHEELEAVEEAPEQFANGGNVKKGTAPPTVVVGQSEGTPPPVAKTNKDKEREVANQFKNDKKGWENVKAQFGFADGGPVEEEPSMLESAGRIVGQSFTQPIRDVISVGQKAWDATAGTREAVADGMQAIAKGAEQVAAGAAEGSGIAPAIRNAIAPEKKELVPVPTPNNPSLMQPQTAPAPPAISPEVQAEPNNKAALEQQTALQAAFNKQKQGAINLAAEQGKLGEAQASILEQDIQARTKAMEDYKQQVNDWNQEQQNFIQDVNSNMVDPNRIWSGYTDPKGNKVPGMSKVSAIIGMIVAGFNPTNRPNMAIETLNKMIDQDIDAQKANLGAKQNLLAFNMKKFNNLQMATDMTRSMMMGIVADKMQKAQALAVTPIQKANLQMQLGAIEAERGKLAMINSLKAAANNTQDPAAREKILQSLEAHDPKYAQELRGRILPGVPGAFASDKDKEAYVDLQEVETSAVDQLQRLKTIKQQFESYSKASPGGTGPIATLGGATKYISQPTEEMDTAFKSVSLDALSGMKGMAQMFNSNVERAAFESTNPSINKDDKTNLAILDKKIGALESTIRKAAEAKQRFLPGAPVASTSTSGQAPSSDVIMGRDGREYTKQVGRDGKTYMVPKK